MATSRITPFALAACCTLLASPVAAQGHGFDSPRLLNARLDLYGQSRGPEQTESFSRSFRVGRTGTLDLSNFSGDITVTGGAGEEIAITAVKRIRERDAAAAKQQLADVSIEATERAGRVEVRTVNPQAMEGRGGRHPRVEVDFTVSVPSGVSVYLKSYSGSMKVTNVKGEIREETLSGDVEAFDAGKLVRLKTMSGDVDLSTTDPDGEVSVSTLSGTALLRNLKTRALDASTISGDLRLTDVVCGNASLRSVSGNIEFAGDLVRNGRYEMKSHSGNVRLALGGATGFEIDAETFSGNSRSDLPLTQRAGGAGQEEPGRRSIERRSLRGTFGDGSAVIQVKTFSGDVTIVKR